MKNWIKENSEILRTCLFVTLAIGGSYIWCSKMPNNIIPKIFLSLFAISSCVAVLQFNWQDFKKEANIMIIPTIIGAAAIFSLPIIVLKC